MSVTLLSSPLQGFTDFRFRNTYNKYFKGIDTFYSPYIRISPKLEIKPAYKRDILPENNTDLELVPQILTNNANEFLFLARYVQELGYTELNWNLGCPYPMVTLRGMGSGLINDPVRINDILNRVYSESDITVSIKMRLGYNNSKEILKVLPVLDKYSVKNIAIHPRIGKQLYKGDLDLDAFKMCIDNTNHKLIYNGDITSVASYRELSERFPMTDHWMIGRGLIADPFLPGMIKSNTSVYPENRMDQFRKFHDTLFHEYEQALSGPSHILMKMLHFWGYFITSFANPQKGLKMIKKAKSIREYEEAIRKIVGMV